ASIGSISAYDILSATFYVREAGWTAGVPVNLHLMTSNWSESSITWNSHSNSYNSYVEASASPSNGNYAGYDITNIVRDWLTADLAEYGFMLVSTNETSVDKTFCSSEHGTADNRPYVVVTYASDCNPFYSVYNNTKGYYMNDGGQDPTNCADNALQLRANCYGYAFRFAYGDTYLSSLNAVNGVYAYKQLPGEFANKSSGLIINKSSGGSFEPIYSYDQLEDFYNSNIASWLISDDTPSKNNERLCYLEQLMQADARALGYRITEYTGTTIPDAQSKTRRLIAVAVGKGEFHFYMQHSDNTWSHKYGSCMPTNLCLGDHQLELTNTNIMGCVKHGGYENAAVKFYYITKSAVIDYMHYNGQGVRPQTQILVTDYAGNCKEAAKDIGTVPVAGISGAYDYINDVDYYQFRTNTSGQYTFNASTPNTIYPLIAVLYDDLGNVLHQVQSTSGSVSFTYTLNGSGQYFVSFSSTVSYPHGFGRNYLFAISPS
ncbi:MAG: DNRLRE domain-containing protein, partial [Oscillospiraceae bacterium]|nr:DNRLRE domain-containing protein [Oscillospiraceae bacterium]